MLPQPSPLPDPLEPPSSVAGPRLVQPEDADPQTDLAALAARFSAQSGGGLSLELSAGLALEIVLNEIVEQACLATGATGAAIVLKRDGEMVCRASSGSTAPDLGSPLETSSGLSGECVRTLHTQRCDDALADTRVDVTASLRLGVRSVMVMPLLREQQLLGVFELFSSRPFAFGDRDERTLEALASRALANLERAERPLPPAEVAPQPASPAPIPPISESREALTDEVEHTATGGSDYVTLVLAAAVVACTLLLGLLVGRHFGAQRAKVRVVPAAPAALASGVPTNANSSTEKAAGGQATRPTTASKPRASSEVPPGGLLVYQNGKEIFRMPPRPGESGVAAADRALGVKRAASIEPVGNGAENAVELPPALAEDNVLYRVEPEYPEAAREQKIQGAVEMEVHIGADGTVENVEVVSGPPQLMQAAAEAVTQWHFKPRTENGHAVRMQTRVTLNFRLPG